MSFLSSWMILPALLRAFIARVILTRWAPVKKLKSSCVNGNWITVPCGLTSPCSLATLVTAKLPTRLVNQLILSLKFLMICNPTWGYRRRGKSTIAYSYDFRLAHSLLVTIRDPDNSMHSHCVDVFIVFRFFL